MYKSRLAAHAAEIKEALANGESQNQLAERYGVARSTLQHFVKEHVGTTNVIELRPESGDNRRLDAGKTRGFYLIPYYPLSELARVYEIGAVKYAPRGWEAGMDWSRVFDPIHRHLGKWLKGEQFDAVDGQHHLASVAWAAFALMEYEQTHPELDDIRPGELWVPKVAA